MGFIYGLFFVKKNAEQFLGFAPKKIGEYQLNYQMGQNMAAMCKNAFGLYSIANVLCANIVGSSYKKMLDICRCNHALLGAAYSIKALAKEFPDMHIDALFHLQELEGKAEENGEFEHFFTLLKADNDTLWQHQSEALITLLHKYQDDLAGVYDILGEFESYVTLAELKKQFDVHARDISFSEICVDSDKPQLDLVQFWNPLVDAEKAVPNSLSFACDNMRHMILTGSNTGGKSTLLKAALINILFAQTYGVVFAKAMKFTPFDKLLVSLNAHDDTAGGDSLFMSEIKRAKNILEHLQSNQRCFVACDELFNGTSATNAGKAARAVLEKIGQHPQALSVFATHHGQAVTSLADALPFKNMKMDVKRDAQGNIHHTFKCNEGISQENIADDLLEEHLGVPKSKA